MAGAIPTTGKEETEEGLLERLRTCRLSAQFPQQIIFERRILPVAEDGRQITLVSAQAEDRAVGALLTYLLQKEIRWIRAGAEIVERLIRGHYGVGGDTLHALMDEAGVEVADSVEISESEGEEASVVRFVNQVIREAHRERATDIHLEPMESSLRIRYRVDGVLHHVPLSADAKRFEGAIISRVKVMAGMDIAERRLPQDGRLKARVADGELDVRVSTIPTAHGESVSLRLLARGGSVIGIEQIGLRPEERARLEKVLRRPHGIVLLTGPTGCGKSTTLYACLRTINREELRLVTIEDPVESQVPGVNQVQVRPEIGFDFARGLRHVLRQDPDVIMVGEIRDHETAEIAIRASLTGHLVLSTLHTNDAPGAVTRLLDMGVEPFLVASSLQLVIAQRLVRKLCRHCAGPADAPSWMSREQIEWIGGRVGVPCFRAARGCAACHQRGFLGRTAIHEFMVMSEALGGQVLGRASAAALHETSVREGMLTLRQDGWIKAAQGVTTVDEVARVTEAGGAG